MLSYFGLPVIKLLFRCCFVKVKSSPVKLHHIVEDNTNCIFYCLIFERESHFEGRLPTNEQIGGVSPDTFGSVLNGLRYKLYTSTIPVLKFLLVYFAYIVFPPFLKWAIQGETLTHLKQKTLSCDVFSKIFIR